MKTTGLVSPLIFKEFQKLKQYLLAFDDLAILSSDVLLKILEKDREKHNEIEWLMNKNLLKDGGSVIPEFSHKGFDKLSQFSKDFQNNLLAGHLTIFGATDVQADGNVVVLEKDKKSLENTTRNGIDYYLRAKSIWLSEVEKINNVPILTSSLGFDDEKYRKGNVIQIIIKQLPIPSEKTSWEQILDFKSDPDSKSKFLALKNWMSEVSRGNLSIDLLRNSNKNDTK